MECGRAWRGAQQLAGLQWITLGFGIASCLLATRGLAADAQVAAQGGGVAVRIVRDGVVGSPSGKVSGVVLNIEVTEDAAAELYGYRSMNSLVDIDCRAGRDRVRSAQAFERPHLAGASHRGRTSGEWVRPTPGAYMSDVIERVCSHAGLRAAQAAQAVAKVGPAVTAPSVPPPASSPMPPGTGGPPKPARLAVPAMTGASSSRPRVQVASSASEGAARALLDEVRAEIAPPLTGAVETAEVRGKTVYRSVVGGFGSEAEAQTFCARMKQARGSCIVWKGASTSGR